MKFSIVTPSFRNSRWLKLCIASVADQQGVEFENIVQDSCSDNGTQDWLPQDRRVSAFIEILKKIRTLKWCSPAASSPMVTASMSAIAMRRCHIRNTFGSASPCSPVLCSSAVGSFTSGH
jgi:GT2 family glycosyltransferase